MSRHTRTFGKGRSGSQSRNTSVIVRDLDEDNSYDGMPDRFARRENRTNDAAGCSSNVTETAIPNFLLKLWRLVEDKNYDFCISWDQTGSSFHVLEPYTFSKDVLPLFFKHSNMNSFIRQLNMYGFRKVANLEQGALKHQANDTDSMEFHHQYFIRGRPELLAYIKRRAPNSKLPSSELVEVAQRDGGIRTLNQALEEIRQLREKQQGMDTKLTHMKRENQVLWKEIAYMRQMHMKQQKVVNKMMQFMLTLAQPAGGRLGKRSVLAIDSGVFGKGNYGTPAKRSRTNSNDPLDIIESLEQALQSGPELDSSPSADVFGQDGPMIADITEEAEPINTSDTLPVDDVLMSGYAEPAVPLPDGGNVTTSTNVPDSALSTPACPTTAFPDLAVPSTEQDFFDDHPSATLWQQPLSTFPSTTSPQVVSGATESTGLKSQQDASPQWEKPDFTDYVDGVQADLDTLKDFLLAEGLEFDTSVVDDLFPPNEGTQMDLGKVPTALGQGDIVGNELQVYKPPEYLVDFDDLVLDSNVAPGGQISPPTTTSADPGVMMANGNNVHTSSVVDTNSQMSPLFMSTPSAPQQSSFISTTSNQLIPNSTVAPSSTLPSTSPVIRRGNDPSVNPLQQPGSQRQPNLQPQQTQTVRDGGGNSVDRLLRSAVVASKSSKRR